MKMTKVYFVRHAQPAYAHEDDRTRPLTAEGADRQKDCFGNLKGQGN